MRALTPNGVVLATWRTADASGVHKRVAAKVYALFDREWPGLGGRGGM